MLWKILPFERDSHELVKGMDVHPLIGQLLFNRGITDSRQAETFLYPSLRDIRNPFLMKGMEEGVNRFIQALLRGERIAIYGDYDVDGLTSVALLKGFLSELGLEAITYVPNRIEEGYGLNAEALKALSAQGVKLLITVDCGISDRELISLARSLGMDTIVIDHHEPPEILPPGIVINPLQKDCPFPFKGLAAVGVTFMFLMALRKTLRESGFFSSRSEPNLKRFLDLVALGTVADVVPVKEENRIFLKFGFIELRDTERPGLKALKEVAGVSNREITYEQVAFRLAPRLNAGGRIGLQDLALRLLLTEDEAEAMALAEKLEEANRQRQFLQEDIYREAYQKALAWVHEPAFVLHSDNWHPGVIGIVASKLAEDFYKPTILITFDGPEGVGSVRGIPEVHIKELLERCRHALSAFGGHKAAAGLRISRENLEAFREAFLQAVREALAGTVPVPCLVIDMELPLREVSPALIEGLDLLSPFGPGNPDPLFCSKESVAIEGLRRYEKDVSRFSVVGKGRRYEAVSFTVLPEPLPRYVQIAFMPRKEFCEGYFRLTLEVRALRGLDLSSNRC